MVGGSGTVLERSRRRSGAGERVRTYHILPKLAWYEELGDFLRVELPCPPRLHRVGGGHIRSKLRIKINTSTSTFVRPREVYADRYSEEGCVRAVSVRKTSAPQTLGLE